MIPETARPCFLIRLVRLNSYTFLCSPISKAANTNSPFFQFLSSLFVATATTLQLKLISQNTRSAQQSLSIIVNVKASSIVCVLSYPPA
jgi:hypothetical protein